MFFCGLLLMRSRATGMMTHDWARGEISFLSVYVSLVSTHQTLLADSLQSVVHGGLPKRIPKKTVGWKTTHTHKHPRFCCFSVFVPLSLLVLYWGNGQHTQTINLNDFSFSAGAVGASYPLKIELVRCGHRLVGGKIFPHNFTRNTTQ